MTQNPLRGGRVSIELGVVAPAVCVIAKEPPHGGSGQHIAGKVLPRADARNDDSGGEPVSDDGNDAWVGILVSHGRSHGPSADGVSGGKTGVPSSVGAVFKTALAIVFQGASAIGHKFCDFHRQAAVK